MININRQIEIIDSNYYNFNIESKEHFKIKKFYVYQLFHFKFYDKIKIQDNPKIFYYIINPRYSFSSFDDEEIKNNKDSNHNEYISYYNSYINNLNKKTSKEEYFTFITCRYLDNSFKIYRLLKNKPKKEIKPI